MKCVTCGAEQFKVRELYRIGRTYYICRKCGKANRIQTEKETNPSGWAKKAVQQQKLIRAKFLQTMASYRFKVLIWGPSEKNPDKKDVYSKRRQVRDLLREKRQEAFFSEEIGPIQDEIGNPVPINVAELLQTESFDLVINIADSPGSLMEAEKFTEGLQNRCLLWLRKGTPGFQSGVANQLASIGLAPIYFDDADIKSCVIALACEDWVHTMRAQEVNYDILQERVARSRIRRKGWIQ